MLIAQLAHIKLEQCLHELARHAGGEIGAFYGRARRGHIGGGEGRADLQLAITRQRPDMREGQLLRIPFQPPQFHLIRAELHRKAQIAQLFMDGEGFGLRFGKTMGCARHVSLI